MKLKTKMLSCLCMFAVALTSLIVGVWALKTVDFTVGGNLSYVAPGIEATISKGTLANGTWVTASDANTKMPLTQITRQDTTSTLATKFSYWQNLNLAFNEAGDDTTITFSITNDMAEKYLSINVTTSYASADNATISINTSSKTLAPNGSQQFVITLSVTDKTADASLSGFSIVFNMEMTEYIPSTPAEDVSYLTFTYDDTTMEAKLTGWDGTTANVVIPSHLLYNSKTYKVTSMAGPRYNGDYYVGIFSYNSVLKTVSWSSTIKEIEEYTFSDSTELISITIPDSVTGIDFYAFSGCAGLTSITIPASVTSITGNPFAGCSGLETIVVESGNTKYNSNNNCNAIIETATNTLITGCKNTAIPSTVTSIGGDAFYGCTGLTSITIPDKVTSIGNSAFWSCTELTSITIPDKVTSIGTSAFNGCTGLTSITIPDSVTSLIGYGIFFGCTGLTSVIIGNGVTSIGYSVFSGCTGLTSITIPDKVTSIDNNAFRGCTKLATVNVKATTPPTGGTNMFYDCSSSLKIYVPTASVSAYKAATNWSTYSSKIYAGSF